MLKTVSLLLKNRLYTLLMSSFFRKSTKDGKKRGVGKTVLISILAVYLVVVILGFMGLIFSSLAPGLIAAKLTWLYFAVAAIAALAFSLIGSVFTAQSYLFNAKDNELLLSMPVKPSAILLSRVLMLLVLSYIYEIVIIVPAGIVFSLFAPFTAPMLVAFIIGALLLPLLSVAVSCVLGWLIGLLTAKARRKNLISALFMFFFIFVYMYICMTFQSYINQLIANGQEIAGIVRQYMAPVYNFGMAAGNGSIMDLLLLFVWCIVPIAVVYLLLAKSFTKILTANKGSVKVKYKGKAVNQSSPRISLLKKEISYFFSLPAYIFNCGFGTVMSILFGGFMIFQSGTVVDIMNEISPDLLGFIPLVLITAISICSSMNDVSAPSISLEGKTMWIIRSTPAKVDDVFFAKSMSNVVISLPGIIIAAVVCWFVVPMSILDGVMLLTIPILVSTFTGMFGLSVNLMCPRFDWVNETAVLKQSASVLISVMGSLVFVAIPFGGAAALAFMANMSGMVLTLLCLAYFIVANLLCFVFLRTKGKKVYESLAV